LEKSIQTPVFQSEQAKTLPVDQRSFMEQPTLSGFWQYVHASRRVDLVEPSGERSEVFVTPERIEVAPGVHTFLYNGGQSWLKCPFALEMAAGHTYQPTELKMTDVWHNSDCRLGQCFVVLTDRHPSGEMAGNLTVPCKR
jgi:hypothetical protein